jgi:hypothetical protein
MFGCDATVRPPWRRWLGATFLNAGALALVVLVTDAIAPRWSVYHRADQAAVRLGWVLVTATGMTAWNAGLRRLVARAKRAERG